MFGSLLRKTVQSPICAGRLSFTKWFNPSRSLMTQNFQTFNIFKINNNKTIMDSLSTPESISAPVIEGVNKNTFDIKVDSVMRKRRTKMKNHKLRKRRRLQRAMKRRLAQGN